MKKFFLSCLAMLMTNLGYAAKPVDLSKQPLSFLVNSSQASRSLSADGAGIQVKESGRAVDPAQTLHVLIHQTYGGYRVYGTDAIVHTAHPANPTRTWRVMVPKLDPNHTRVDGTFYRDLAQDLKQTPEAVFKTQESTARAHVRDLVQTRYGDNLILKNFKIEPMIYIDANQQAHYAFYATLFLIPKAAGVPVEPVYILDATNLTVYKNWNNVKSAAVKGGGVGGNPKNPLIYDGVAPNLPQLDLERDANQKICFMKNTEVSVFDFDKIKSWENVTDALNLEISVAGFPCDSPSIEHEQVYWNTGFDKKNEGDSPNNDTLFAGNTILKMYQNWYGVDVKAMFESQQNQPLKMVTHIVDPDVVTGSDPQSYHHYENAFWSDNYNAIFLGDGGDQMYPLTSLGVITHEVSHGVTSHRMQGALVYEGQSGALNESFSDMAAQAAQYFVYGKIDGQIGPEIMKAPNQALRYMDKPSRDCGDRQPGDFCSIDHASQYQHLKEVAYQYTNSEDQAQSVIVHFASGVFNRAFYILATSPGWDPKKAFQVMVWANLYEWKQTPNFNCAANGVIKAAAALKYETAAVIHAFDVVGVKPDCSIPSAVTF